MVLAPLALKEALGGVGLEAASVGDIAEAVGKIASKSLKDIGETALTSGQKIQIMSAEIEDLKVQIGEGLTPAFHGLLNVTSDVLKGWKILFSSATTESENFAKALKEGFHPQVLAEARVAFKEIKDQIKGAAGAEIALRATLVKNKETIEKHLAVAEAFTGEVKRSRLEKAAILTVLNQHISAYLDKNKAAEDGIKNRRTNNS